MIPPLDKRGLLPPGTHVCDSWGEVALHFATNAHRVKLMQQMQRFIAAELAPVAKGLELYLGGSYLSDKAAPSDIDCTLVMPIVQAADRMPLINLSADGAKGRIYQQYGVEFYLTFQGLGRADFTGFFAYVGEKTAQTKHIDAKDLRGIIKVQAWTPQ